MFTCRRVFGTSQYYKTNVQYKTSSTDLRVFALKALVRGTTTSSSCCVWRSRSRSCLQDEVSRLTTPSGLAALSSSASTRSLGESMKVRAIAEEEPMEQTTEETEQVPHDERDQHVEIEEEEMHLEMNDHHVEVEYLDKYRNNVGMCVVNNEGLVFAARRVDDPTGAWQMPQGGIDAGEEAREACLRELEEETGINPKCVEFVGEIEDWLAYDFPTSVKQRIANAYVQRVTKSSSGKIKKIEEKKHVFKKKVYRGQRQKWFLLKFVGQDSDIDLVARGETHREFSEWCWIPLDQLSQQIVFFKKEVYEQVSEHFCPLIEKEF